MTTRLVFFDSGYDVRYLALGLESRDEDSFQIKFLLKLKPHLFIHERGDLDVRIDAALQTGHAGAMQEKHRCGDCVLRLGKVSALAEGYWKKDCMRHSIYSC